MFSAPWIRTRNHSRSNGTSSARAGVQTLSHAALVGSPVQAGAVLFGLGHRAE
jgi:hypothetical protein